MLDSKKYKEKRYIHFDHRVNIERVEGYVTNPNKIAKHSFLPFIHYVSSFARNIGEANPKMNNRPIKNKDRDIMYAGHLDSHIYKYYAEKLNCKYNNWTWKNNIDECSTAYRNNKDGQSNIEFAAEVINSIVNYEEAYILVGDFTKYFDKINHRLLKKYLLEVMDDGRLSNDWYNVYRSITKFGYYRKDFLVEQFGTDKEIKNQKMTSYFKSVKEFRKFQSEYPCDHNKEKYGIPQGTAISVVFANVYAINFDTTMKQIAKHYQGIYRRYSDDFILVIPKRQSNRLLGIKEFEELEKKVRKIAENDKIEIQEDKTELLEYKSDKILNLKKQGKDRLDYLGFVFDGKIVKMRGKSPYKFYREAYKLISYAKQVKTKKNLTRMPYMKQIYGLYTDLGIERGKYGNFIRYAIRAQEKFDELSPRTENIMLKQIKNRKKNIEKKLGIRIHTDVK